MAPSEEKIVYINGKPFRDVTNKTVSGSVYTYEEARALAKGILMTVSYKTMGFKHIGGHKTY